MLSPCVGICTLDDAGFCMGCHRSPHEITHWARYGEEQRRRIMESLEERAHRRRIF